MKKVFSILIAVALLTGLFAVVNVNAEAQYVDQTDFDGNIHGQALDIIRGDGVDLYTPGQTSDYLFENSNVVHGPFQTVTMRGWFGVDDLAIKQFGYAIGDNAPVFSDDFFTTTEDAVIGAGGEYALRYEITMDVSALGEEETLLMPVVKLEDDTVLAVTFNKIKYTTKAAPVVAKPETYLLTTGSNGAAYNFNGHMSIGFRFKIPEGYKLSNFIVVQSPTWNGPNEGIGLTASIYTWTGDDYEETIDNDPIAVYEEVDHKDNSNLVITYDYIPAGEYLIELTEFTGNIGGWMAPEINEKYADMFFPYVDEEEVDTCVHVKMAVVVDDNPPEPTEVPTAKPTAEPTEVPTEAPATEAPTDVPATDVPATDIPATEAGNATENTAAATDNSGSSDTDTKENNKSNTGLVVGIIIAAVAVCAIVAGILIAASKKKKK